MRFKLTILLLVLNAALAGFIFYLDKVQSTKALKDDSSRLILNPDFVQGMDRLQIVVRSTGEPWELERTDTSWTISSPINWKANPYAVAQLLFQLKRLAWDSRFPVAELGDSGQSLQSYNLADAPIQLILHAGETSVRLSLGSPTEIGNRLYLMSPISDYIYVVPRGLLDSLNRELETFLDRRIFSLTGEETRALQIQDRAASNVRVRLERNEQNWRFVSPIETAADPDRVRTLLAKWQGLEVKQFEPQREIPLAMDGNSIRLTLEGLGKRETLILTPPQESDASDVYYLARREAFPAVFQVNPEFVDELRSVQENLRERRILTGNSEEWTSLTIQFGNLGLTLQQLENGAWQVLYTSENGQLRTLPASQAAILNLKKSLKALETEQFITDAPSEADLIRFGLNEPQRMLRIRAGNRESFDFRVGGIHPDHDKTLLYANTNQSDSVFLVRPYILTTLSLDPYAYRERTVRSVPSPAKISSFELIHRPSGLRVGLEAPAEKALRDLLRTTRVERFLNKPFSDPQSLGDGTFIEWKYLLEAQIQYPSSQQDSTETIRLYLSDRLGGTTQYVGDPGTNLVGTLSKELIQAIDPSLAEYPEAPVPPPVLNSKSEVEPGP